MAHIIAHLNAEIMLVVTKDEIDVPVAFGDKNAGGDYSVAVRYKLSLPSYCRYHLEL